MGMSKNVSDPNATPSAKCSSNLAAYKGTVLVLWPQRSNERLVYGNDYPRFAMDAVCAVTSHKPLKKEQKLVDYLLGLAVRQESYRSAVLRSISAAACQWGDTELWHRAMDICHGCEGVEELGQEGILTAIEKLELCGVLSRFDF